MSFASRVSCFAPHISLHSLHSAEERGAKHRVTRGEWDGVRRSDETRHEQSEERVAGWVKWAVSRPPVVLSLASLVHPSLHLRFAPERRGMWRDVARMWCEVRKDPTNGGNLRSEPRSRLSTSPFGSLSLGVLVPSLVPRVSTRHLVPNRRWGERWRVEWQRNGTRGTEERGNWDPTVRLRPRAAEPRDYESK